MLKDSHYNSHVELVKLVLIKRMLFMFIFQIDTGKSTNTKFIRHLVSVLGNDQYEEQFFHLKFR